MVMGEAPVKRTSASTRISPVSGMARMIGNIAEYHHENMDGSGYPCGLRGDEIPIEARIVAVADVFDALTSERPYKKAWSLEDASLFLEEGRGTHFDPACVDAFLASWSEVIDVRQRFQDADPSDEREFQ